MLCSFPPRQTRFHNQNVNVLVEKIGTDALPVGFSLAIGILPQSL